VVIDEVQKLPDLLSVVHALIESKKKVQFILSGSSARKLKRAGVDLLAGRALLKSLHPFMAAELGDGFGLESALRHGLLPLVAMSEGPGDTLRSYVGLYVKEEVQMEGLVRNLGGFHRFLEAISFSHASVLNLAAVARECEVERKTVEGFVGILEDMLLAFRVPAFSRRARRKLSVHPKFYLVDAGVFRSLRPRGPLDRPEEIEGAALEGLVVAHLRAWNAYRGERNQLHHWRTRSGVEVDCVLYGEDGLWALEVKNAKKVQAVDLHGLKAFREDYPQCRPLLIYRGKERLEIEAIRIIPCDTFLGGLDPRRDRLV